MENFTRLIFVNSQYKNISVLVNYMQNDVDVGMYIYI